MKVVIVGGVAGGASAAARIRRLDEHAQIIMIERSGYVSYANCGLPYYVGGVIKEQEELTLQTPESFWDRFRIDVRVRQEVTAINPTEKTVTVHALDSGKVYTETYDKLLLAPGAKPTVPALSGVSSERVFTLRTVEDTLRIRRIDIFHPLQVFKSRQQKRKNISIVLSSQNTEGVDVSCEKARLCRAFLLPQRRFRLRRNADVKSPFSFVNIHSLLLFQPCFPFGGFEADEDEVVGD